VRWLPRVFALDDATPLERRATIWTGAMFCAAMGSTFVLRPLRDQFGVDQGVERMPYLYSLTLLVTALFTPAFWWLANRSPSRRFVPVALQVAALLVLVLFVGLEAVPTYDWKAPGGRWTGEVFWGFFSAFNVAIPTLVWIHAVEHFRRDQALRLFGLVGVGGTAGAVLGSEVARQLVAFGLPPSSSAVASIVLLQATFFCHRKARIAGARLTPESGPALAAGERVARGGVFAGLRLLVGDRHLMAIAGYMLLLGMVATAFAVSQTELVGRQVAGARAQHGWLAHLELLTQSSVLVLQLFLTGRLLPRLPAALFLCLLPALAMLGLGALWLWPTVAAVGAVQIARRSAQFALEKPSREALYTPLDLETKHKVKFLLDTFAFRAGDLLGAGFQVWVLRSGPQSESADHANVVLWGTVALAAAWAALGIGLGRRSARRAAVQAVAPASS
jgi:AAA family ATP:ADP antiporter